MLPRRIASAGAAVLALSIGLCTPVEASEPLRIAMGTWAGYGLLYLARDKGFFKEQHVDVELSTAQDKPSIAAAMATKRLEGWATTVDTFIFYNADKLGAKQVLAVDEDLGGSGIVANGEVATIAALKGKTIAAEEGSSTFFFLLNVLADAGLRLKDVKLQTMQAGDAGAAFVAGRVDAAATWDPWLGKAKESAGGHILVSTRDKPGLIVDTVAFRSDVIADRPQDVTAFIRGYFEALDYYTGHREESLGLMSKSSGIPMRDFENALTGFTYSSRLQNEAYFGDGKRPGSLLSLSEKGIAFYRDLGIVKAPMNAANLIDAKPLTQALHP